MIMNNSAKTKYMSTFPPSDGHTRQLLLLIHFSVVSSILISSLLALAAVPGASASDRTRGISQGVSDKSISAFLDAHKASSYPWTNNMLASQRTAYHFQPQHNWMNDPNGPLFYKGWYHIFYQYNPYAAVWGNITWGHAVSRDLLRWRHLPLAMIPNHWYDINGVWTGSATLLPNASILMLYTGSTSNLVQLQNLAFPTHPSDPLLRKWTKYHANPILSPPPGIFYKDFRDPTTAWHVDGDWHFSIGSKVNTTGVALVYKTSDFRSYQLIPGFLHAVPGTGMWECVDFYPVSSTATKAGLDTSASGHGLKHVLKASLDDDKHDYYAIGTYDAKKNRWTPDDPEADVGIGIRYDYGKYYASKTFYDPSKRRRVLWGWTGETDSEKADVKKGWASVLTIPREVLFDTKTRTNVLQWPIKEVESLRFNQKSFRNVEVKAGSVVPLNVGMATQLDILAEFEIAKKTLEETVEADVGYNCSTSGGARGRGLLGPFGILVAADQNLIEQTAVYFYVAKGIDGRLQTFFCQDELRSSKANDVVKRIHGSTVPVLKGEKLSLRILVDHSIVESFAQGGRRCITSRVYPTEAIDAVARVFLFNNASAAHVTATFLKIWNMKSADIRPYNV